MNDLQVFKKMRDVCRGNRGLYQELRKTYRENPEAIDWLFAQENYEVMLDTYMRSLEKNDERRV